MAINSRGQFEATDQASLTFVESQAAKIEREIHEEKLVDIQWPQLIQVYSDLDPADDMLVSYISRPGTGRMTPLADGATDIPLTDIEYDTFKREAYAFGMAYGWDDMEIERAQKLGRPLAADKVRAAYRVADEEKERTVLHGNPGYGWPGLITNHPTGVGNVDAPRDITVANPWGTGDTTQPFDDLRRAFDQVFAASDKIEVPDTLLVPNRAATYMFNMLKTSGGLSTMSLWDYIRENNPYTKMYGQPMKIMMVNELDTADGGNPLAILYSSSIKAIRFIISEDLNFLPPQRQAWNQIFYGKMKLGGVQYLRPKSMCLIKGIGST